MTRLAIPGKLLVLVLLSGCLFACGKSDSTQETQTAQTSRETLMDKPALDAARLIDVWQLREEVSAVESLSVSSDWDQCYPEGDTEERISPDEERRRNEAAEKCVAQGRAAYAKYQTVRDTFNRKWIPLLKEAITKGDLVAEVIVRQCETTEVLDRSWIESTCDAEPERRTIARSRLMRIGFVPAVDVGQEMAPYWSNPKARPDQHEHNQIVALRKIRGGALGYDRMLIDYSGNVAKSQDQFEQAQRWAVIEAVTQDAPRAFSYSPGDREAGWATSAFDTLRLNREPQVPGYLTWGPALYYGGSNQPYTGSRHWRTFSRGVHVESGATSHEIPFNEQYRIFVGQRKELLAEIDANIGRYLHHDPRWAVFLLNRVGHHEWVPVRKESNTHFLAQEWIGKWKLEKTFADWHTTDHVKRAKRPSSDPPGDDPFRGAEIYKEGELTRISFQTGTERSTRTSLTRSAPDATGCVLRYSGGSTYLPKMEGTAQSWTKTMLGYFYDDFRSGGVRHTGRVQPDNSLVFAPFDPKKRYKQVLVQCEAGESLENDRVRFLLLAGDTLVEVAAEQPYKASIFVRHYRRVPTGSGA